MGASETFQIPIDVAEAYEARFVPAIFAEWAPRILDAAGVVDGHDTRLLDVACGTGVVARAAADRVGADGVVGLDLNEAMLTVARRIAPEIEWQRGDVTELEYPDASFDVVTCQMALMFVLDLDRAFLEMARVARPGGRVAVVVPAALDDQPAYRVFVDVAARRTGPEARSLLSTYWNRGDRDALAGTAERAGLQTASATTVTGTARFASAHDFVMTEIGSSPLIERIDRATADQIADEVADLLPDDATAEGYDVPLLCPDYAGRKPT
jgi:ubiquinone/menaquinone biosynthesis C-methylase UbiE